MYEKYRIVFKAKDCRYQSFVSANGSFGMAGFYFDFLLI